MSAPETHLDPCGVPLTAANAEAAAALEDAILGLVSHSAETGQHLERALAFDPELLLAHVVRGFGLKLLGRSDLAANALLSSSHASASWAQRGGTERERLFMESLRAWSKRDPEAALVALEEVLTLHPLDRLAVKLTHAMYFYFGMKGAMRESLERVLPVWRQARPVGLGRVLGSYAFALTESGESAEGERVGREALQLGEVDPWGMHATLHAIEARGGLEEALEWLSHTDIHLASANNFHGHVYWHQAVIASLLGRWEEALALYDTKIAIYPAHDYRDLLNEVTLLHRFRRAGHAIGERAERCAEPARHRLGDHGSAFADVHHVLSLLLAEHEEEAEAYVESMRVHGRATDGLEARILREIAVPVSEAICMTQRNPLGAERTFASLVASLPRLGGSRAQHAVFELLQDDIRRQLNTLSNGRSS